MVVISVYIYGVEIIKNSGGKMVYLRGFHGIPPYALMEGQGTLCS